MTISFEWDRIGSRRKQEEIVMAVVKTLSQYWFRMQSSLFPWLEEQLGELTQKEMITTMIEQYLLLVRLDIHRELENG